MQKYTSRPTAIRHYSLHAEHGRILATAFPLTQLFAHAIVKHNFRTLLLSYTTAY